MPLPLIRTAGEKSTYICSAILLVTLVYTYHRSVIVKEAENINQVRNRKKMLGLRAISFSGRIVVSSTTRGEFALQPAHVPDDADDFYIF